MKLCERNMRTFYYALYEGITPIIDEFGNESGDFEQSYSAPIKARANISPARGNSLVELFGESVNYDKSIILGDTECPIDEHSILWIDKSPYVGESLTSHDYEVKRVAKSLTNIAYAVKKVDVS